MNTNNLVIMVMKLKVNLLSPAKINLGLEILGKRSDGYHEVDMVMQTVGLFDEICVEEREDKKINVTINRDVGCDSKENIAYKSAKKFFEYTKINGKGVDIHINKNIPICAGLAGGSSDGAAVVVGMNNVFNTNLMQSEILKICEKIGADVPFCVLGGTARATGIGTTLTKINSLDEIQVVIVKPSLSISTREAYSKIDNSELLNANRTNDLVKAIKEGSTIKIISSVFNRFEEVNGISEVKQIKKVLRDNGAEVACMSGSGPSVFGLFWEKDKANAAFKELRRSNSEVFLCKTINYGVKII